MNHEFKRFGAEFEAQIAIEWRRHAALLHVAQNVGASREDAFALLGQDFHYEICRIIGIGHLVAQQDASFQVALHLLSQMINIVNDIENGERLLEYVGLVGTAGYAGHRRQIATIAAHGLDDEDASLRANCRLPYLVTNGDYFVEGRVAADAQVSAGHVVRDGGRHAHNGHAELFVLAARLIHLQHGQVGLEAADDDETVDFKVSQLFGDVFEAGRFGIDSLTAQNGAAHASPAVDTLPVQLFEIADGEALETVSYAINFAAHPNAMPYKGAHSRIDATSGRAHIHHAKCVRVRCVAVVMFGLQFA